MNAILEDLTTLPPKRLEKRLEELARDALPCHSATVFDGNPEDGLTVAVHVDSRRRQRQHRGRRARPALGLE